MLINDAGSASRTPTPELDPVRASTPQATATSFADSVRGTSPQWTLDTDLAAISNNVYNDSGTDIGDGHWSRVANDAGFTLKDPDSGFQAAIYSDGHGRYVVAFAGTDPKSIKDWINNAQQGVGLDSGQYDQAIELAQQAVAEYGADNVVFTGHSLGGGLASAAALATGNPAVTFNAAGVGPKTLRDVGLSLPEASQAASEGQIRRYNVENDILTNAQQKGPLAALLPDALGYEITLENPNTIEDPVRAHLNGAVTDAMKSRDIKSQQSDNLFERWADHNLFPGGPSAEDLYDTSRQVADYVAQGLPAAFNIVQGVVVGGFEAGRDFAAGAYDKGKDLAGDVVDAGEDFVGSVADTGGKVVDKLTNPGSLF